LNLLAQSNQLVNAGRFFALHFFDLLLGEINLLDELISLVFELLFGLRLGPKREQQQQ
jgi:hypothetical protein